MSAALPDAHIARRRLCQFHPAGVRLADKMLPITVFPGAGKMTVRFQAAGAGPICRRIARFQPPWVKNAAWHLEGNSHGGRVRDRCRFRLSRFQGRHPCRARYPGAQDRRRRLCPARHGQSRRPPPSRRSPMPRPGHHQHGEPAERKDDTGPPPAPADTKTAKADATKPTQPRTTPSPKSPTPKRRPRTIRLRPSQPTSSRRMQSRPPPSRADPRPQHRRRWTKCKSPTAISPRTARC